MKALSVLQPWAHLIVVGAKRFETRSWKTDFRGPLLIHAGKSFSPAAQSLCQDEPFKNKLNIQNADQLTLGAIIGIAILEDCIPTDSGRCEEWQQERHFGDFHLGRYAWKLKYPTPLAVSIPLRGTLGVFDVQDDIVNALPENQRLIQGVLLKQQSR